MGSTRRWRERRMWVLRLNPWCVLCPPRQVYAIEVDHIVPLGAGGTDDYANLQGLCRAHHLAKTQREANASRRRIVLGLVMLPLMTLAMLAGCDGGRKRVAMPAAAEAAR